ncbi:MAG: glycogen synthase [Fimbriimonadales bacterium]|nr:glycogen synthase [Fimbriimonadales bacterium]
MRVLFVSVEVSPFAKVGGLADVAGSLPKALRDLGHDVRIAMPAYKMVLDDPRRRTRCILRPHNLRVGPAWVQTGWVRETLLDEVPVWLFGTDRWFDEVDRSERIYLPGEDQYLFLARAILDACKRLGWIPDVIHCNDWHTGFVPVLLRESREVVFHRTASVFTIHNLAYQGEFGVEILDRVGLPRGLFDMHRLETYGCVNFLKSACVYSEQVNTVSPTYAREIQTPEYGCRLEGLMAHLASQGRLSGILNGIDTEVFNPRTDPCLPAHYGQHDLAGKAVCKEAVLREVGLQPIEDAPLMGVVSRLSSQKGMDLMIEAAEAMFQLPAQLIVQGLGDPWLAQRYRELEKAFPHHFRYVERFDAELAQRVYAGSDLFLMPSSFEPCGLGQMIALRYGTIPIVRRTGGLADTVFEGQNGFVFERRDVDEFLAAVRRAHSAYQIKEVWLQMVDRALHGDYSWGKSAREYESLYQRAAKRRWDDARQAHQAAGC